MTNPLLRDGVTLATGLATTIFFLLCVRYTDRNPYARLYRTVPLSLAWMCGSIALYALCQMVFPILATPWYDALGNFVSLGVGASAGIFYLRRARYVEDTGALLVLLFVLFVLILISLAGVLPHPASSPSFIAYYAAWCAIGSVALLPCIWFDRWLQARLGPILPRPAFLRPAQAQRRNPSRRLQHAVMISVAGAITSLALVTGLFLHHQLDSFVAALPWAAALMLGLYLLGTAIHWGLRYLFLQNPVYGPPPRPRASSVTVTAEPFDEQQANQQLYQGPTSPDGTIPVEVQTRMDELLRSGEAANIFYYFDNGLQGSRYLPSYCTGEWPQCQTCTCREASQLPLPAQGREE